MSIQSEGSPPSATPRDASQRAADSRPDAVTLLRAAGRGLLAQPRGLAWVLPAGWASLVWWLSSDSRDLGSGLALPEWLKALLHDLAHPFTFGLLALITVPLLPRSGRGPEGKRWVSWTRARGLVVLVAVATYGAVDEWHQSRVPGRVASVFDLLSDATGAAAVLVVVGYLSRPDADRAGVMKRLALGALACLGAAALSSGYTGLMGDGLWFGRSR